MVFAVTSNTTAGVHRRHPDLQAGHTEIDLGYAEPFHV